MQTELDKADLFELADTLGIEFVRDKNRSVMDQLRGSGDFSLRLMEGLNFAVHVEVIESGVYQSSGVAGVIANLCGPLYAVVLVNTREVKGEYLTLWLVDGARLGWKPKDFGPVFPVQWNRGLFGARIRGGVVACYQRNPTGKAWVQVEDPKAGLAAVTPQEGQAATFIMGAGASTAEKYRTKGPRGV